MMDSQLAQLNILSGIKIVSFTQFLLGPAGTQLLADMGADVVTVEPPDGAYERKWSGNQCFLNGWSMFYLTTHRNTRSIAIDLKNPKGHEAAYRLARQADVVIQNARPGVMDRLGLGYEDIRKSNPNVIYLSASGFGDGDLGRALPGQDLLLQALTGLADITGKAQDPPTPAGAAIIDVHGGLLLAMGAVSALLHRFRTGEGQHVQINMLQAALNLQIEPVSLHLNGKTVTRNGDGLGSGYIQAPYGVYKTSDDECIVLSSSPIQVYYNALQDERLVPYLDPEAAWTHKKEIRKIFEDIMITKTAAEWVEIMSAKGVWMRRICTYEECFEDPVVQEIDPVMTVHHPEAGDVKLLKFPINFGSGEAAVRYFGPGIGEHTGEILGELGFTEDEIRSMQAERAVIIS